MSPLQTFSPLPDEIGFDADLALRFARVPPRARGYERTKAEVIRLAERYRDRVDAVFRIGVFSIASADPERAAVDVGGRVLEGAGLFRRLEGCDELACFVATLGEPMDAALAHLRVDDFAEAFLLDAVASALVQSLQDRALEEIGRLAASRGRRVRPRHAPGYHGWPLSGQETLLALLDATSLGVRLTDGFLMLPHKTVSGACGLDRAVPGPASDVP